MSYVELHCHSNFSLLDGASHPEELVARAKKLGMAALALTDHDGLYGAVQFFSAANKVGIKPIIGAEITLEGGYHLTVLAKNIQGYSNLCRLITKAQLDHSKGSPFTDKITLTKHSDGLICLSGCRSAEIPRLLLAGKDAQAADIAQRYADIFGADRFFIELQNNLRHDDAQLCQQLIQLADSLGLRYVATNNVHYDVKDKHRLQDVLVCIKNCTTLEKSARFRRPNAEFYLKSTGDMESLFRRYPQAISNTDDIAGQCNVDLDFSSYRFPNYSLPDGETADSYLARLCWQKVGHYYTELTGKVRHQLTYELDLISKLGLSGYFLIVWDIMEHARENGIPAQGRGSAANSIVAYILGITRVDPIRHKLFVGRFINEEMSSLPDIDIDVSTNHREKLIQYVYRKYGEEHVAMVCTYVTFQARNAIREVGKVLGMPANIVDRMAKTVGAHSAKDIDEDLGGLDKFRSYVTSMPWQHFVSLCHQIADFPRHLSIHVGGMIISSCPLTDIVPLERATMPGRVVCQWDKDGVEEAGLVKVDILGLRMLSLIDDVVKLVREHHDSDFDLGNIPLNDTNVYDMICRADTLGVFQVESRAQMQTLPRTMPRSIEDLTVEVAIIRPGPLQGNMVHPYIRRRQGKEKVSYPHPKLKPILEETKGVILFQEQVLRAAIAVASFTPGEADSLRRAMSKKRSHKAMEEIRIRFLDGARKNGINKELSARIFDTLQGFAEYGFCKSHAAGFALLAYESAWLKYHYPAEFYAALLNNQPMGFYSPEVIIGDARRHDVRILPVDINVSEYKCTVENGMVRLGFSYIKEMGETAADTLVKARTGAPFTDLASLFRRTKLSREAIDNLILAGATESFGNRRQLLWESGRLEKMRQDTLQLDYASFQVPLPGMTDWEELAAEYSVQGLSARLHPMEIIRESLSASNVLKNVEVERLASGTKVSVAGYVVCRQAPRTAKGHVFLTLEDETGLVNIILRPDTYQKYRYTVRTEPLVIIDGVFQKRDGISNILAQSISSLRKGEAGQDPVPTARNFC